jgi:hypothetical protein
LARRRIRSSTICSWSTCRPCSSDLEKKK